MPAPVNCWSCQVENPPAAKFCFNCGSRLEADPVTEAPCRQCAAPLPLDARFCGNCGTPDPLAAPVTEAPIAGGLADLLEPARPEAAEIVSGDEEATIQRQGLEEAPMIEPTPGLKSRDHLSTEPAKVAASRTLAERLGRSGESPGAYSKQNPSLRKADAKRPPPPPTVGSKLSPAPGVPARSGPPAPAAARPAVPPPPVPAPSKVPPTPASTAMTVPAPSKVPPAPASTASKVPPLQPGKAPPAPASTVMTVPAPSGASRSEPRITTEPQKVVFSTPRPSEVAEILASPEGWPDITDELAELRFSALQGIDDGVRAELAELRAKYPGHPEVEALAAELAAAEPLLEEDSLELPVGVPRRTRPPVEPSRPAASLDGPPPLGRYPSSSPSQPGTTRPGAPRPAPAETSDELLDAESDELDDLDEPDPGESMTDMTIVERLDLERLGVRDADDLDGSNDDDDDVADDLDEPDEPDFVDRTLMVPGLQPPAPFGNTPPDPAKASRAAGERRPTLAPEPAAFDERRSVTLAPGPAAFDERRRATLAPGSALLDDERRATLPPGGLVVEHDDPPTLSGIEAPSHVADDPTPLPRAGRSATLVPDLLGHPAPPSPYTGPGGEPPPDGFMTAPDRDADTAAASGQFRVADLGLDDMPDLTGALPPEPDDIDIELTVEGTVVARAPQPPAPYGPDAPLPVVPVRLVMLGSRGEAVAERSIQPGAFLDLGRRAGEPWAEDRRMELLHARLFPGPGGVIVDDFGLPSGVYTQIIDTIAVEDGDEFKVGQARLALQRVIGRGWGQLTLVRHDAPTPETILLDRDEIIIGRDEGDITLPSDTFVSGDHCRFIREGNAVYLEDLGSSNGTYIRVRAGQCVAFGGLLLVGHTQFRVQPG